MAHSLVYEKVKRGHCAALRSLEGQGLRDCLRAAVSSWPAPWLPDAAGEPGLLHGGLNPGGATLHEGVLPGAGAAPSELAADALTEIELDLLTHACVFAKEQKLGDAQMSAFLSILWRTHRSSVQRRLTLHESHAEFQKHMIAHAVHRPPSSEQVFTLAEVRDLQAYVLSTYYRAYKLYQYCFTPAAQVFLETQQQKGVPLPPQPFRPLRLAQPAQDAPPPAAEQAAEAQAPQEADAGAEEAAERQESQSPVRQLPQPAGLKAQLETIAQEVTQLSAAQLEALEAQMEELEGRLAEAKDAKGKKGKK
eukprot:TRINITY_DN7795_c0_g1_i2.p1 TRINITY_DN7795_c0_g1~~TRINITY_DN7795_c0_g1_i2.p1  ORF type:complete len:329 (+),score=126.81 TRINITY_DN7795_c0_g1_i2:69-989(+)